MNYQITSSTTVTFTVSEVAGARDIHVVSQTTNIFSLPESITLWMSCSPYTQMAWSRYAGVIDKEIIFPFGKLNYADAGQQLLWVLHGSQSGYVDVPFVIPWGKAIELDVDNLLSFSKMTIQDVSDFLAWSKTATADANIIMPFISGLGPDVNIQIPWGKEGQLNIDLELPLGDMSTVDVSVDVVWGKGGICDVDVICPWSRSIPLDVSNFTPYTPGEGTTKKELITTDVILRWLATKGIFIVDHDITLKRVSDNSAIHFESGNIAIDENSWLWSMQLSVLGKDSLDLINPSLNGGPVEVELSIDGYVWRMAIDTTSDRFEYGSGQYSAQGKSTAMLLGEPYQPKISKTYTSLTSARSLVLNELNTFGWSGNWNLLDWDIAANTFSVNDLTPAQIVALVAKSVGGIMQAKPATKEIDFLYKFPDSPKNWANVEPDEFLLAGTILGQEDEWDAQPQYNYVIVSGKDNGVLVHVRRSNTLYDKPAPMVIDPLVQTTQVGVQRGRNILDDQGYERAKVSLDLPLAPYGSGERPKLLFPGDLIQASTLTETYKAKVASTNVSFSKSGVTMTLQVYRYFI